MTLLIQENGSIPLLAMEGRTGTVSLWPGAVAALKARDTEEQQEWLLRHAEQFSKRDADRLRNWFGAVPGPGPARPLH
ncbi:hypothetical protein SAMN05444156_1175 [Verrucomicrobium sp. GAS474]|uniref:hypothetical protein n=1 Tax=Verrucomicrobium sp. GAS474 TaxID=1882831 RepID=UPI000879817F|nr:hypothetical protein [Verrucomicrobium sp. GAS474]SDT97315.1 hypothetical protein SAMN05444156_1175 [Verrucomicrobium sp. GAS474]